MSETAGIYDLNFCYPIDLAKLRNERVKLIPFNHNLPLFASLYVSQTSTPVAINNFRYLPYGPFTNSAEFLSWYNKVIQPSGAVIWFAILVSAAGAQDVLRQRRDAGGGGVALDKGLKVDLTWKGEEVEEYFAGSIGLLNAAAENAVCEIGHRTFVTTTANSLLLHYLLDPIELGNLGLRRVVWQANARNERSVKAAQRLGFVLEGIIRWHRILPEGKDGETVDGDGRGPGRDTAMLSICWDDWRDGVKEKVRGLSER